MAVILGFVLGGSEFGLESPGISAELSAFSGGVWTQLAADSSQYPLVLGAKTYGDPGGFGSTINGFVLEQYKHDFYFRIHIIPNVLDVGAIVTDDSRTVSVWNSFFSVKNLSQLVGVNDDAVIHDDPVALPYDFSPLEIIDYEYTVQSDGPADVDATFTYTFNGEDSELSVVGSRLIVFPFPPNWKKNVVESLSWLTNVLTSRSGKEQRITLRKKARRNFQYTTTIFNAFESGMFENMLYGWQSKGFALPVWTDKGFLSAAQLVGDLTLHVDPDLKSYYDGGLVVIFQDTENFETLQIDTVNATDITLSREVVNSWPAGTAVFPLNTSKLANSVSWQRITDDKIEAVISFDCDPYVVQPYTPDVAESTAYNGYEVYEERPNWIRPVQHESIGDFALIDNGYGRTETIDRSNYQPVVRRFQWLLGNRDQIYDFRAFLQRRKGRFKPVYLPTWNSDLEVVNNLSASATEIVVRDNFFAKLVGQSDARKHLYIRTKDGNRYFAEIDAAASNGDGTAGIGILAPLGVDILKENFLMVCFLGLYRFRNDSVDISWVTSDKAIVQSDFWLVKQ